LSYGAASLVVTAYVNVKLHWWDCLQRYNVDTRFQENGSIGSKYERAHRHTHTQNRPISESFVFSLEEGKQAEKKKNKKKDTRRENEVEESFKLCTLFLGKLILERLGEPELGWTLCLTAHASLAHYEHCA
jgi:hypothetical protein